MYPVGRAFQFAAELAEEDINSRADVLPGYRLVLEPVNTQVRESERERGGERECVCSGAGQHTGEGGGRESVCVREGEREFRCQSEREREFFCRLMHR